MLKNVIDRIDLERAKTWVVVLAISLIPTIYGGLLIASVFDPTHHLNTIPAAVVNEDTGARPEGKDETINLGNQIAEKLLTNESENNLNWVEMSASEAQEALEVGDVYAVINIPPEFSANAVSVGNADPSTAKQAVATITSNDGSNVVMGSIARTFADALELSLDAKTSQQYLTNIYAGFNTLDDALGKASSGASELHDGSDKAANASLQLAAGLNDLKSGTNELNGGVGRLKTGAGDLAGGASKLSAGTAEANSGVGRLASGLSELNNKFSPVPAQAQQLADGSAQVADGVAKLDVGANAVSTALAEMRAKVRAHEGQSLRDGIAALVDSTTRLHEGTSKLEAGTGKIAEKADALATKLDDLHAGVRAIVDRMRQLSDNLHQVSRGSQDLSDRVAFLQANYDTMSEADRKAAIEELAATAATVHANTAETAVAAKSIHDGASAMVNEPTGSVPHLTSGARDIADGTNKIHASAESLNQATQRLMAAVAGIQPKVDTLDASLDRVVDGAAEVADKTHQLSEGARKVADGNARLSAGLTTASSGIAQSASGATQLQSGTQRLADGSSDLADGASKLAGGASTLADGTQRLNDGTTKAADGAGELSTGLGKLNDGTQTLADKLAEGGEKVPSYTAEQADHLAEVASAPVSVEAKRLNEVPTYGHGLAPYFMAVALWVGAIGYFLMFPAIRKNRPANPQPAWVETLQSYAVCMKMALAQSLILIAVLIWAMQVEVVDLKGLVAYAMLSSFTFFAINQALVALLGAPGRFIALILAAVQLASAGGTYPIETSPDVFQWLHPVLPLSYAVESFRSMIAGGRIGVAQGVVIMTIWWGVGLALLWLAVLIRNWRGEAEPEPETPADAQAAASAA